MCIKKYLLITWRKTPLTPGGNIPACILLKKITYYLKKMSNLKKSTYVLYNHFCYFIILSILFLKLSLFYNINISEVVEN